jgi:hypothetical protein
MAEIRTRDEALAAVDAGLAQWSGASVDLLTRALAAAGAAQSEAESEVARRASLVAQLTDTLACLRADDPLRAVVAAQLARARDSLAAGQRAAAALAGITERVAALHRSQARNTQSFAEAARADLARRGGQLTAYRATGAGGPAGGRPGRPGVAAAVGGLAVGAAGAVGADPGRAAWLAGNGLSDVDVAAIDFSDNPITGMWGRGELTRADYRWAVTAWDEVIRPGLDRGMSRDDFAARDAASGAREHRRYADVYDWFFSDTERIKLDRWPDGTVHVANGRHRFEIARELGVTRLPVSWGG